MNLFVLDSVLLSDEEPPAGSTELLQDAGVWCGTQMLLEKVPYCLVSTPDLLWVLGIFTIYIVLT